MADQDDAHPGLQDDENPSEMSTSDLETARDIDHGIHWCQMDEKLRIAHDEKVENSQKPSMWEYNPKGGVPTELADLDPLTFFTSRQGGILCFLPKDVLIRICSMLSVCDFVDLSLTCRFLHWRMFTFCTCYVPTSVDVYFKDRWIDGDLWENANFMLIFSYFLNNGFDEEQADFSEEDLQLHCLEQEGLRVLFIQKPFCLRKPFFFDTLKLFFFLPFYRKKYYDMCLPYILAVRGLARNLDIFFANVIAYESSSNIANFLLNYSDTNDFFTTINPTFCDRFTIVLSPNGKSVYKCIRNNTDIYINCPYSRQMKRVFTNPKGQNRLNVPIFENKIGIYWTPLDSAIIATLKNFLTGSMNLVFHKYYKIEENNGRFPLLEYLFQEFGKFEEFLYVRRSNNAVDYSRHVFKKILTTENGEQLRIEIKKPGNRRFPNNYVPCVAIGKEQTFDEITKYIQHDVCIIHREKIWWKMETAMEPDDVEESEEAQESEEAEKSNKIEESEEAEEEQRTSSVCCRLEYNSCTIQ